MDIAKRDKVLAAARGIFLRYGFKRVTMNDIAEAASISRPALYLVFELLPYSTKLLAVFRNSSRTTRYKNYVVKFDSNATR